MISRQKVVTKERLYWKIIWNNMDAEKYLVVLLRLSNQAEGLFQLLSFLFLNGTVLL